MEKKAGFFKLHVRVTGNIVPVQLCSGNKFPDFRIFARFPDSSDFSRRFRSP